EKYVKEKKEKNILLWSKKDILYIENLIQQLGPIAKYQIYSVIFTGKKQKSLKKSFLALRGKMGGRCFYSFFISAKELLNYTYVHHRKLTDIVEASQAYQRMLRSTKLKQKSLKKSFLALRGKMGGRCFYSFFISAKELLNYTYVHHRKLTDIVEASQAYQRMLRSTKLKEIKRFIDDEEGYFANSIIINFSKQLK
ncbi:unnamed protein product, partial [marine sediment metagenome]